MVNIQIPLQELDSDLRERIEWKHGNLCVNPSGSVTNPDVCIQSLTTKLPFDDDEFDHVHVSMIAKGVPENKVSSLSKVPSFYTDSTPSGVIFSM